MPPYEPEMNYHVQHQNGIAGAGGPEMAGNGIGTMDDGLVGADKKPYPEETQMASEMEAKLIPQEMPEEPHRWHELESPPPAA